MRINFLLGKILHLIWLGTDEVELRHVYNADSFLLLFGYILKNI